MLIFKLIIIFISYSSSTSANEMPTSITGCPSNSLCTKESGEIWKKWSLALKSENQKTIMSHVIEHGLPIKLWATVNLKKPLKNSILWDSPCAHHKIKGQNSINVLEVFLNSMHEMDSQLKDDASVLSTPILQIEHEKIIHKYSTPIFISPTHMTDVGPYFSAQYYGHYYGLIVQLNGQLKYDHHMESPLHTKQEVKCGQFAIDAMSKEIQNKTLYTQYYCQNIWHKQKKKFIKIVQAFACD